MPVAMLWAIVEDDMIKEYYDIDLKTANEIMRICLWNSRNDCDEVIFRLEYKSLRLMDLEVAKLSSDFGVQEVYACTVSSQKLRMMIKNLPHKERDGWTFTISLLKHESHDYPVSYYIDLWGEDMELEKCDNNMVT